MDESGEPNGIFRENAMDLIYGCLPEPAKEDIKEMILAASKALNRYGVTSSQTDDLLAFNNVPYEAGAGGIQGTGCRGKDDGQGL